MNLFETFRERVVTIVNEIVAAGDLPEGLIHDAQGLT